MCSAKILPRSDDQEEIMVQSLPNLLITALLEASVLLLLLHLLSGQSIMSPRRQNAYMLAIVLAVAIIIAELAAGLMDGAAGWLRIPHLFFRAVILCGFTALPFSLAVTCDDRMVRRRRILAIPPVLLSFAALLSMGTGWLFTVSADNRYIRGPFFWIYVVTLLVGMALQAAASYRQTSRLRRDERVTMLCVCLLYLPGILIQLIFPSVHCACLCITLTLMLYYIFQREAYFRYDQLTGALNRATFEQDTRDPLPPGTLVMVFDLDDFKTTNDVHGHDVGDECLHVSARILLKSFDRIGSCYRIGGDEFVVIGQGTRENAEAAFRRMISRIRIQREKLPPLPNISYGLGLVPENGSFSEAFREADQHMYRFKSRHGATFRNGPREHP